MPFNFPDRPNCTVEELRSDLKNSLFPHISRKVITATIDTTQTDVAHGLRDVPTSVTWSPRGDARVWRSADPDKTFVRLTASASVIVDIEVSEA